MNLIKKIIVKVMQYICIIIVGFIVLFGSGFSAYASEEFKGVVEELKSDPKFNEEDYPDKIDDYNLYVMQIAETSNKELILYVYQPSHIKYDLQATKISLSYGFSKDGKNLTPKLYPLKLLDTEGVFDKYLVSNYEVPKDTQRYYNIVSIYRTFNTLIDKQLDNYGDFTDISISVGQQWYVYDINDSVAYEMNTFKTMLINTNIVENLEFSHGLSWGNFVGAFDKGDCWFIAFNAPDYAIEHIYDADMTYAQQKIDTFHLVLENKTEYGEVEYKSMTLTDKDTMSYQGDGLLARKYQWNRILSANDFLSKVKDNKVDILSEVEQTIKSSQYVFTFLETERTENDYGGSIEWRETYYNIFDVGILRLHFMDTTGMTYDLGVVNNLFNPDNIPGGYGTIQIIDTITSFFQKLFAILGLVVLVLILLFISNLLTPFISILKEIWKAIKYVLSLPFRLLKWVFKRR